MQLNIRIEANEIKNVPDMTFYNHITWELTRHDRMGISHIIEEYDDVSDCPSYKLGIIVDGKFKCLLSGEGDPMPVDYLGIGGIWIEIGIYPYIDFAREP